jgi:hypothetical protein
LQWLSSQASVPGRRNVILPLKRRPGQIFISERKVHSRPRQIGIVNSPSGNRGVFRKGGGTDARCPAVYLSIKARRLWRLPQFMLTPWLSVFKLVYILPLHSVRFSPGPVRFLSPTSVLAAVCSQKDVSVLLAVLAVTAILTSVFASVCKPDQPLFLIIPLCLFIICCLHHDRSRISGKNGIFLLVSRAPSVALLWGPR